MRLDVIYDVCTMNRDAALAVLKHIEAMLEQGNGVLHVVNDMCSEEERKRFHEVLGTAVANIDLDLLEPIYKEFPDLRPPHLEAIKPE
jgi:hypothetical protein